MFRSKHHASPPFKPATRDDELKRILSPVFSSTISPLRPSTTSSTYRDSRQHERLFAESCAQLRTELAQYRWPFCPIYLLHINTYYHADYLAIPAEIALVETTFWPQLYAANTHRETKNISKKIDAHYERHANLYKRFCPITDDFHDFVHPGDQLPTGCQADILEHSRRTHGLPCTPHEKIGSQDYNQLLDDLHEMLRSLCESRQHGTVLEWMPMFCTLDSFWSTKAALDWLYEQPSTRDRLDDYTLYPIEALVAVIYENFYQRAEFKCDLRVLMGKTPQQPLLHSRACDYHAILDNKYCAMAHVRDLAKYYTSLMAYLFYTYCDQNSSAVLPYIKATYQGDLSLQQEVFWSGRKERSLLKDRERDLRLNAPVSSYHVSSNGFSFENTRVKKYDSRRETVQRHKHHSNLNPLAVPFSAQRDRDQGVSPSTNNDKIPAQLVLFEPRTTSSGRPSCQTTHQRMHHRPQEDWD